MKLQDLIHAPTRPTWTARLVLYVALVVTVCAFVQIVHIFWLQ